MKKAIRPATGTGRRSARRSDFDTNHVGAAAVVRGAGGLWGEDAASRGEHLETESRSPKRIVATKGGCGLGRAPRAPKGSGYKGE